MIRQMAGVDLREGIANDKRHPWKSPGDAAYFESHTTTVLIVMGWATYNEFLSPLHGRDNHVLSSDQSRLRSGFQPLAHLG